MHTPQSTDSTHASRTRPRVGSVSYLNAKPLIEGLESRGVDVTLDIPARQIDLLTRRSCDAALCPVADLFLHDQPLVIIPVGGIGCEGPTLTVRLFSRVPLERVNHVYADTDSHTSVRLLRIVMQGLFGHDVTLVAHDHTAFPLPDFADAALLIGDKVVTAPPPPGVFQYELDLGEAWQRLTGLPFVFAVWTARSDDAANRLARVLEETLESNLTRIDQLVARYAGMHGWPESLASHYLGQILRYRIGPRERQAIRVYGDALSQLHPQPTQ